MGRGTEQLIKKKIRSVTSTMHITRAMEMVATAKLQQLQRMVRNFYDYEREFSEIFTRVISSAEGFSSDLVYKEKPSNTLIVIVAGDMGLSGSYNGDVIVEGYRRANELGESFAGFYAVGSKVRSRMAFDGMKIRASITGMYDRPSYDDSQSLANEFIKLFREEEIDSVEIVHGYSKSALVQRVKNDLFLPVMPVEGFENKIVYDYEPEPEELLNAILPQYLATKMYRMLLESRVSEQQARQNAMRNATKNAKDLIEDLTLGYNKARQASITQEIIEVTNGSEALKD